MSAFTVCLAHRRFYPCASHACNDCRWSNAEDDVFDVAGHILSTTLQQRVDELRNMPEILADLVHDHVWEGDE